MCVERELDRRTGHAGDRGGGDDRNYFEKVLLPKSSRQKRLHLRIADTASRLDQGASETRQSRMLRVRRRPSCSDRRDIRNGDALSKREIGMEGDGPCRIVRHRVSQKKNLDLRLVKRPAWTMRKTAASDSMSAGDVAIAPAMFGIKPNAAFNPLIAGLEASGAVSSV
jgi:hypothetical protein